MTNAELHERVSASRAALAATLEPMAPEARVEAMAAACVETGGTFVPTRCGRHRHFAQVHCLGVLGAGETEAEAVRGWMRAARRMAEAEAEAAR